MFNPTERDAYNEPYIFLRERLNELGYNLKTSDENSLDDCTWVLFFDIVSVFPHYGKFGLVKKLRDQLQRKKPMRDLYSECVRAGLQNKIALFLWEAPAALPENWDKGFHKLFPIIFTWHDEFVDQLKYHKIFWPQTSLFPVVQQISFVQKKLLLNISMNKSSKHPRELYSSRKESILYFQQYQPKEFDLYGIGWDNNPGLVKKYFSSKKLKYTSYRGVVKHKWDVLPYYRFCLCYENIRDEPGWITEKIFDSMRAGCVPIYWGASNITDYVDKEAFVDRRLFNSNKELEVYLTSITENQYAKFQEAMIQYLNSPRFAHFLANNFADTIIRVLSL